MQAACSVASGVLPALGPCPAPLGLGSLEEEGGGRGQHIQTESPRGRGLVLAWGAASG